MIRFLNYFIVSLFLIMFLCNSIGAENNIKDKNSDEYYEKNSVKGELIVTLTEYNIINMPKGIYELCLHYEKTDTTTIAIIDSIGIGKELYNLEMKSIKEISNDKSKEIFINSKELIDFMEKHSIYKIKKVSTIYPDNPLIKKNKSLAWAARQFKFMFSDTLSLIYMEKELKKLSIIEKVSFNHIAKPASKSKPKDCRATCGNASFCK